MRTQTPDHSVRGPFYILPMTNFGDVMICFDFIFADPDSIDANLSSMFHILYSNMNRIMPTGNSFDEDYSWWMTYRVPQMQEHNRKVVLFYADGDLIGFCHYSLNPESGSIFMEEMQIQANYQGSGVFSAFYSWLVRQLPDNIQTVEAHTGKTNYKAQAVLEHLGLFRVGENCSGKSYHYKGAYATLLEKYS